MSEQRLPAEPQVGIAGFNYVSHYYFFPSNAPSINVQDGLFLGSWFSCLPLAINDLLLLKCDFRLCFEEFVFAGVQGTAALQAELVSKHESLSNIKLFEEPNNIFFKCDTAGPQVLATLISVPWCHKSQIRITQSCLLVLWGAKQVFSALVIVFGVLQQTLQKAWDENVVIPAFRFSQWKRLSELNYEPWWQFWIQHGLKWVGKELDLVLIWLCALMVL